MIEADIDVDVKIRISETKWLHTRPYIDIAGRVYRETFEMKLTLDLMKIATLLIELYICSICWKICVKCNKSNWKERMRKKCNNLLFSKLVTWQRNYVEILSKNINSTDGQLKFVGDWKSFAGMENLICYRHFCIWY